MPDYLTAAGLRESLNYDSDESDTKMDALLSTAEAYIGDPDNGVLRRPVVVTAFSEEFDSLSDVQIRFPDGANIADVTYTDADGAQQTLGAIYTLRDDALTLTAGNTWPSSQYPVTVNYSAGFADVPQPIIDAGYFYAGTLLEAQSDASAMNPDFLRKLMGMMLAGYRRATI